MNRWGNRSWIDEVIDHESISGYGEPVNQLAFDVYHQDWEVYNREPIVYVYRFTQ